ncbi:MAG: hypothetical protein HN368_02030 [Spirochaetales bacterium]|nr:hypothetical protein [Spirochaetales bacterium]
MELQYKPDFGRAKDVWTHFWEGEIIHRPPVLGSVTKQGSTAIDPSQDRYLNAVAGNTGRQLETINRWLENSLFLGEQIPSFSPDHGPDQMAACLGSKLVFNPDSKNHTNWAKPVVDNWQDFLPLELKESNQTWQSLLRYSTELKEHSLNRYLVSCIDFHTHYDALAALRHNDKLCMDFYDCPDLIEEAAAQASSLFPKIYDTLYAAGNMGGDRGSIGAHPFWSAGKFGTIQCDFIALIGPEMFRRFVMPAIGAEAAFLDQCSFHLDGPAALTHLDDILSIPDIDVIQWVPGAGQPPDHEWVDLMKKCQKAGKAIWVRGADLDRIKVLHRELVPSKVIYSPTAETQEDFEQILKWLTINT